MNVPSIMRSFTQFVVWKLETRAGRLKPDKVPYCPRSGAKASVRDPATWSDYSTACHSFQKGGFDGIGFVFTNRDPFAFIDIDDCRTESGGEWNSTARSAVVAFPGAWEVSQSGKGLHGIGITLEKSKFARKRRKWTDSAGTRLECYFSDRFVAFGHLNWVVNGGVKVGHWAAQNQAG